MKPARPTVADLAAYDEIIDVRSPAEFAEDHIPGAINCPVLDNAQRAEIGTLYKQVSAFEAKKLGAAMASEAIARHLRERFLDRPKSWKPLIYCWRGGDRSGSMTTVLRAIGWAAGQLDGGYKAWRRHVVADLETLPAHYDFRVLCGATGNAKTRVLQALGELGEQVLDLETLASHKGSVLGVLPDQPQPSQKWFETTLHHALVKLDPTRPVFVEAESRKIGNLHVPEALIQRIRTGTCRVIDAPRSARVAFLLRDYDYFLDRPEFLLRRLDALKALVSRDTLTGWQAAIAEGNWTTLVDQLLAEHYDPLYQRSQHTNYTSLADAPVFTARDLDPTGIQRLAEAIAAGERAQSA